MGTLTVLKTIFLVLMQSALLMADTSVTVNEGTNIAATLSPDRKTIVMDLQGVLWSLPFEGGTAKALTDPFLEAARPAYSPKGDLIAFEAYKGGTFHIWIMKPDGTDLRQITAGHGDDREPCFSPDGKRIAFASDRAFKGSYDIWVVNIANGALTQWTSDNADEYEPAWSEDGSEIAFISGVGANGTTIQALKIAGGKPRTIITAPPQTRLESPAWSPDGSQVSYVQVSIGKSNMMIADKPLKLDDVFPFPATWLGPDELLYTANGKIVTSKVGEEPRTIPFEATFNIHKAPYDRRKIDFTHAMPEQALGIVSPTLSPDGKQVLFEALNQLWLMKIGEKPQSLTNDTFYKEDPAWSPDGKSIAYSSDKNGFEAIYILNLETRQEKLLTKPMIAAQVAAAWSPDGKQIAFQNEGGITYVAQVATGEFKDVIKGHFAPSKPSWSADSTAISIGALLPYTRRFREGTSQILTANLKTNAVKYSEPAPFGSLSTRGEDGPVYSPDGKHLAFVMNSLLWLAPVGRDGLPAGPARQLNKEATDAPSWSGDSKTLLYLSNGTLRAISALGGTAKTIPLNLEWSAPPPDPRTFVRAGHLWNGLGPDLQSDVDIVIANKRIESITPHNDEAQKAAIAAGAKFVDASRFTVTPGLWESHTHQWISGKFYGDKLGRLWLAYGVTELQSQGDPAYRAIETREAFASGARVGPRYFATGEAIDGERIYYNFMRPVTSAAQLDLELSRAKALHYDNLKTYVRLNDEMQRTVTEFAHSQMGVTTASHYMMPGLAYGVDGITHISATARLGFAYTRSLTGVTYSDALKLWTAAGQYVISTPFSSFPLYGMDLSMVDDPRLRILNTPWDQFILRSKRDSLMGKRPNTKDGPPALPSTAGSMKTLHEEETTVATLIHAGALVLAGTDSPIDSVATALHLNLRAQVRFGQLKPWEALQTATVMPAKAFGVFSDLGSVEVGKLADLVIVSGDPLTDVKDMANVQVVIKDGKVFTMQDLMRPYYEGISR